MVANLSPGLSNSGSATPGILFSAIPSTIDTGIPDTGLLAPDMPCIARRAWPRCSAAKNPQPITRLAAITPGAFPVSFSTTVGPAFVSSRASGFWRSLSLGALPWEDEDRSVDARKLRYLKYPPALCAALVSTPTRRAVPAAMERAPALAQLRREPTPQILGILGVGHVAPRVPLRANRSARAAPPTRLVRVALRMAPRGWWCVVRRSHKERSTNVARSTDVARLNV